MSLDSRIRKFADLSARFPHTKLHPLITEYKVPDETFQRLQTVAALYMSACLPSHSLHLTERGIMSAFERERSLLKNVTPNGMIVPKRELTLEYNLLVREFFQMIAGLGMNDFISTWHVPLNLRYKDGQAVESNLKRPHSTETIHSDSWAGESPDSVQIIFPIFGDIEHNYVEYFVPPGSFDEDWLRPLPTYQDGSKIANRYQKIAIQQKLGHVYLADFCTLHASTRTPGAKARVSIDTTFAMRRSRQENLAAEKKMHERRKSERAAPEKVNAIGYDSVFAFHNRIGNWVEVGEGFKHPTVLSIVDLFPAERSEEKVA